MQDTTNDEVSRHEPTDTSDSTGSSARGEACSEPNCGELSASTVDQDHSAYPCVADDRGSDPISNEHGINTAESTTEISIVQQAHSGPLPTPADFFNYEQVLPGAAERIMRMAEKSLDATAISQKTESRAFLIMSTAVALLPYALLVLSGLAFSLGYNNAGIIACIPVAVTAIGQVAARWKS